MWAAEMPAAAAEMGMCRGDEDVPRRSSTRNGREVAGGRGALAAHGCCPARLCISAPSFFGMELVDLGLKLACGAAAVWPPAMWAMALYRLLEPGLAGSQSSSAE